MTKSADLIRQLRQQASALAEQAQSFQCQLDTSLAELALRGHPAARPVTEKEARELFGAIRERYEEKLKQECLATYRFLAEAVEQGVADDRLHPPVLFIGAEEYYEDVFCELSFNFCHAYDYRKWFVVRRDIGLVQFCVEEYGCRLEAWFGEPEFPQVLFARFEGYSQGRRGRRKEKHQAYLDRRAPARQI